MSKFHTALPQTLKKMELENNSSTIFIHVSDLLNLTFKENHWERFKIPIFLLSYNASSRFQCKNNKQVHSTKVFILIQYVRLALGLKFSCKTTSVDWAVLLKDFDGVACLCIMVLWANRSILSCTTHQWRRRSLGT